MDRQTRMYDNFDKVEQRTIEEILNIVYDALEERGYNAIDQMVGIYYQEIRHISQAITMQGM